MSKTKDLNYYLKSAYDINMEEASKFLCGLYYRANRFRSSYFKRESLLIIYQFWCIKNNKIGLSYFGHSFNQLQIGKGKFFLKDYSFSDPLYSIDFDNSIEENCQYINDDLSHVYLVPEILKIDKERDILKASKDLIMEIFREFGNYDLQTLYSLLEEIKIAFAKTTSTQVLVLEENEFKSFLNEEQNLEKLSNNQIINFICNYENLETKDNEKTFNYNAVISNFGAMFSYMSFEEQIKCLEKIGMIESKKREKIENIINDNNVIKEEINLVVEIPKETSCISEQKEDEPKIKKKRFHFFAKK